MFVFDVDIPPTFSQRLDVTVGLRKSVEELEGKVGGMVGETIRRTNPRKADSASKVSLE